VTIHDLFIKFKDFTQKTDVLLSVLIVVVALMSFTLGRISVRESNIVSENSTQISNVVQSYTLQEKDESKEEISEESDPLRLENAMYVASKNGTKYHLPWCGGAKQIKEENKVFFKTKEEAEKAGYTPASNCKGI
jgi:cell division protein FtsL